MAGQETEQTAAAEYRGKYDRTQARVTERAYDTPEIRGQRMATLEALALRCGEHVIDIGSGPGLLAAEIAAFVGARGRVACVDNSPAMVELARSRCRGLTQVTVQAGDAGELAFPPHGFDAAVCTQVLLYVADVVRALEEMHRVLKPGGRLVIIETDWRGLVLNSAFPERTEIMIQAWDDATASPRLPPVLEALLRRAGFSGVSVSVVPILGTSYVAGNYVHSMLNTFSGVAVRNGSITQAQAGEWLADARAKHDRGEFFFCINRFLFKAFRP